MATTVGTESTLEDLLEDLIALHYDAADAYRTAIDRLDDARFRNRLAEFRRDHCATSLNWRYPLERGPAPSQRHQCLPPRLAYLLNFQPRDRVRRVRLDPVNLAGQRRCGAGRALRHRDQHEPVLLRNAVLFPVILVRHQLQAPLRHLVEFIWASTGGCRAYCAQV